MNKTMFTVNGKTYKAFAVRGGAKRYAIKRILEDGSRVHVAYIELGSGLVGVADIPDVKTAFDNLVAIPEWALYYADK